MFKKPLALLIIFITGLIYLPFNIIHAGAFPKGCTSQGFSFEGGDLVLNHEGGQTYYLMQNLSPSSIEIKRLDNEDDFMVPSLMTRLLSKRWAAFASDVKQLHLQCFKIFNQDAALVNCLDILDVCQYKRVKFALSNMGNYWVSTNKSLRRTIRDSNKKGILLRW